MLFAMVSIKARPLLCLIFLSFALMPPVAFSQTKNNAPSDPDATRRTVALFANLQAVSGKKILFGHQDDLAYGVHWRREEGRSDVQETCGSYPAVFGWDLGSRFGPGKMSNIDSVRFRDMKRWVREAYEMGAVNTFSWHLDNLVSGGNAWDTTSAVRDLLPGGKYHERLTEQLDVLADFFKNFKTGGLIKHEIPVIFRPWHEHTGHWFWWGAKSCTGDEYIALFRFTVDYLRKEKGVHNLLIAYSPDVFRDRDHYLERYPGDDYVDIFGLDYYYRSESMEKIREDLPQKLALVADLAREHGKVAAFTETGLEAIPQENWWTETLLTQLEEATSRAGIAYVLFWRNAYKTKPNHYFVPFPGQVSAKDFVQFSRNERMVFQDTLPKMYRKPRNGKVKTAGATLSDTK